MAIRQVSTDALSVIRVILKAAVLFIVLNLAFTSVDFRDLAQVSVYNSVIPGRTRVPFNDGITIDLAIGFSTYQLEMLFASHEITAKKAIDEYRVILIGDSSVWGYALSAQETLEAQLDAKELAADGKKIRFYNLGFPAPSLVQDLMILNYAMAYEPDLVIWFVTPHSFLQAGEVRPLVSSNPDAVCPLLQSYDLSYQPRELECSLQDGSFWDRTLVGQRRPLADLIRLQLSGVQWAATHVDSSFTIGNYPPEPLNDFAITPLSEYQLRERVSLDADAINAGYQMADQIPVVLVNQPIFIGNGRNHQIFYNEFFSKSMYDRYRIDFREAALQEGWILLDYWNALPADEFSNTPLHRSAEGEHRVADLLAPVVLFLAEQ